MAKQPLHMRRDRVRRSVAHQKAQEPALAAARQLEQDAAKFAALTPGEKADVTRRRSLAQKAAHHRAQHKRQVQADKVSADVGKAAAGAPENKALVPDLANKSRAELAELAESRGVQVRRRDGRADLQPTRNDYLHALGA